MKHILLLLCLNCLGAETNYISNFSNSEIMTRTRQPQIVEIYSVKSPEPWITVTLINTNPVTNENRGLEFIQYDYSCTNLQVISTHQPIVTEKNGKWIITFKP